MLAIKYGVSQSNIYQVNNPPCVVVERLTFGLQISKNRGDIERDYAVAAETGNGTLVQNNSGQGQSQQQSRGATRLVVVRRNPNGVATGRICTPEAPPPPPPVNFGEGLGVDQLRMLRQLERVHNSKNLAIYFSKMAKFDGFLAEQLTLRNITTAAEVQNVAEGQALQLNLREPNGEPWKFTTKWFQEFNLLHMDGQLQM